MDNIKNCYVYWIHLPEDLNIMTSGYVGITINLKKRWRAHKSKHSKSHILKNAINKYGDLLIWETIHDKITYNEAIEYEIMYRPKDHIGWNIKEGGGNALIPQNVRDKISKAHKGKKLTQEHKDNISKNAYLLNNKIGRDNVSKKLKGRPLKQQHKDAISKSMIGIKQPHNKGIKNGRFKPWYFVDPLCIKYKFTDITVSDYEIQNELKCSEIRTRLKKIARGKIVKAGKYKNYLFDYL